MSLILQMASECATHQKVKRCLEEGRSTLLVSNIVLAQKALLGADICRTQNKCGLFVVGEEHEAKVLFEDLTALMEGVYFYPPRDLALHDISGRSFEWEYMRIEAVTAILSGQARAVVTTIEALMQYAPPMEMFRRAMLKLSPGQHIDPAELCRHLLGAGYLPCDVIEGKGQFSRRGGIVDFFAPQFTSPIRVEFFDDEIDTISIFDLVSQRRTDTLKEVIIVPAREIVFDEITKEGLGKKIAKLLKTAQKQEGEDVKKLIHTLQTDLEKLKNEGDIGAIDRYLPLLEDRPTFLSDYMEKGCTVFLSDAKQVRQKTDILLQRLREDLEVLLSRGDLAPACAQLSFDYEDVIRKICKGTLLLMDTFFSPGTDFSPDAVISNEALSQVPFGSNVEELIDQVEYFLRQNWRVLVAACTKERARRLISMLADQNVVASLAEKESKLPGKGVCCVTVESFSGGISSRADGIAILCEGMVVAETGIRRRRRKSVQSKESRERLKSYADLSRGDYVVHTNYGIGRFDGIEQITLEGVIKDYIKISYAGADTLYVPCNQLDLIAKYIAPEKSRLKLNKMGGSEWSKTKARVKEETGKLATELIELYAQRQQVTGFAFPGDDDLQRDFESRFPYDETDDQLRCIEEIKADMEKPVPMDRLLCGDVGFGKTEVALRAAFKCISAGKQVAFLVPTTLLASQHYNTMVERFDGFPIRVEQISRFKSVKEQQKILLDLKRGLIDIVVGTHRLLQKDVAFKDLGFLIIDEEQRFGVSHKERLKEISKSIDVLTLTATPIPRTLNMAMSGIRDMSLLEEPPNDRQPVQSYVLEYSPGVVAEAIRKEMRRGGQSFYLYNRVDTIQKAAAEIKALVPEANILFAHGKMGGDDLSDIFSAFVAGEGDVLVCTTIIETGIDIPNVNTLIIGEADRLGLAQLYQIRGRVGRSPKRAYAYFMYQPSKVLNEDAYKRLLAIKEFTEFGSGFKIAMRDLEIRGAGNLLGTSQHGHMNTVGYDMYLKLLSEAVMEKRGEEDKIAFSCSMDVFISAYIPESYIRSGGVRIEIYKKIAAIATEEDAYDVKDELIDRFGDIPAVVLNLIDIALIRNIASSKNIKEITQKGGVITFVPAAISSESILALAEAFPKNISFHNGPKECFSVSLQEKEEAIDLIGRVLSHIS
jgi:transcription-repair coupling factor (superfamily II helicase)